MVKRFYILTPIWMAFLLCLLGFPGLVNASDELPPVRTPVVDQGLPIPVLSVTDQPNDSGGDVLVSMKWMLGGRFYRAEELERLNEIVDKVEIWRAFKTQAKSITLADFRLLQSVSYLPESQFIDSIGERSAVYLVRSYSGSRYRDSDWIGPVTATASWFNFQRLNLLIAAIIVTALILFFIRLASKGRDLFIRRINGLEVIDEAVGRAAETGRKVMFIPGIMDVDDPQTIAGLTILGRVGRYTSRYQTEIDVPVARSMAMVAGREIVREAYLATGHSLDFRDEMVHYITDDQFGFAAAVDGIIIRERPATIFYQGSFYAESLILAETGHSVGAIQIAGTAMVTQLPFFITACDYTLIGEELFAASAYLSKEPKMLGSLKGQDYGKLLVILSVSVAVILATVAEIGEWPLLTETLRQIFHVAN